jgi:SWI/SNF-related matrix-associated actin-dependent regulator of chromatin subfamily A3
VFYRTVAEIAARSRWCLTGTPIQNRLEDIGSLFAFLRFNPLHNLSNFRKHVAVPFDEGGKRRQLAIQRFAKLLDSLCLRRTKDILQLPKEEHRVRNIRLSAEERTQYDQTQKIMDRAVRNQNGIFDQNSMLGMFQVRLQLRILCNHGTWQHPFSWTRRKLHLLDEREAAETSFGRDGEVTCSACKQIMPLLNTGSMFYRYTEHCRHVLCLECLEPSLTGDQDSLPRRCPLCTSLWDASTQAPRPKHASQADTYFRAEGRSSKMETLMRDVFTDVTTTKRCDSITIIRYSTLRLTIPQHYLYMLDADARPTPNLLRACLAGCMEARTHRRRVFNIQA